MLISGEMQVKMISVLQSMVVIPEYNPPVVPCVRVSSQSIPPLLVVSFVIDGPMNLCFLMDNLSLCSRFQPHCQLRFLIMVRFLVIRLGQGFRRLMDPVILFLLLLPYLLSRWKYLFRGIPLSFKVPPFRRGVGLQVVFISTSSFPMRNCPISFSWSLPP
jgi:hypothetical protein